MTGWHLHLVHSTPGPAPGVLHALVDARTHQVDVVADELYLTVGTEDDPKLAAAETGAAATLGTASAVLRDAHIPHRLEPDGLLIPLETWGSARQELTSRGWTVLTD